MNILYSARHYVVLSHDKVIYCYSYNKLIAIYDVINKILTTDHKQVSTATNKMHLKVFKEYINNQKMDFLNQKNNGYNFS